MPDTILNRFVPGLRHVPSWYPLMGADTSSFSDYYDAFLAEFETFTQADLRAEVMRLREEVQEEGRKYTVELRARKYAAEDVYRKKRRWF